MNLYDYFKENIHMDKIKEFNGDMSELALIRYVMKEASKIFYRDYTFFLNKENIDDRDTIYNKKIDLSDVKDFSIVCKSYCDVIKELLNGLYGIDSEVISAFNDRFRHVDLMIKTKTGNRYIVDPLTDLVEMQVGLRTNNFASKEYYESSYAKILDNISFLTEDELERIDNKIGYKNGNIYLDDFLKKLKINLKLKYISKYLNNRRYLNGFVDLVMFSDIVIKELFSEEEQSKIHSYSFFVDEENLQNTELTNILASTETRKRGRVINYNGKNYIFSLSQGTLEYNDHEFRELIEKNNIFIKPEYPVQLLKYLKANGADRNIVHNNEFLRLFNKFETVLLNSGKTLEDITNDNIRIQEDMILTRFGNKYISYKIEDGHLVVTDYGKNLKYIVFYEDEGRDISYRTEPILKTAKKEKIPKKAETYDMSRDD